MFSVTAPRIDTELLLAKVREVARRPAAPRPLVAAETLPARTEEANAPWIGVVDHSIGHAERFWEVGTRVPPMKKIQGVLRMPAQALARGTLRIGQLVTRDQRDFNQATVGALRSLRNALLQQAGTVRAHLLGELGGRLDALESAMGTLRTQLAAVQQRVTALERGQGEQRLEELRQQLHRQQLRLDALERELKARAPAASASAGEGT